MSRIKEILLFLAMIACSSLLYYVPARGQTQEAAPAQFQDSADAQKPPAPAGDAALGKLVVTVGKSLIIDSPLEIRRLSVANGDLAEAVAVNPKEVLINGKLPGETSLIVWQQDGTRLVYDLTVRLSTAKLEAVRQQIAREFPDANINVTFENDTAFVRGTVKDLIAADRVMAIAGTLGKSVNLLRVEIPGVEPQVVLKVKFANVDHSASTDLAANFLSGAFNQTTALGTGSPLNGGAVGGQILFSQAVNIFLFRRDINLAAAIQALQSKRLLQLLAEPNLLAISGQPANFLAGGEFPFPIVQPSQTGGTISISWREYGIRLSFVPTVTPRGTIRLKVAPEVSSLDFNNAVSVQGVTIPAIASRRVQTEVELDSGQSFVIAGLLDNQASESFSKIPGIGDIPVLGKLFQSKSVLKSNSELLVMITPEIVRPIPAGQPTPELTYDIPFLSAPRAQVSQPGLDKTGPVPIHAPVDSLPVEQLAPKQGQAGPPAQVFQMVPMTSMPPTASPNPGFAPAPVTNSNSGPAPAPAAGTNGGNAR